MQIIEKTKRTTPINAENVFCSQCWWEGAADSVPYGRDPWDADGGALCYCPECGMVDDLNFPKEK